MLLITSRQLFCHTLLLLLHVCFINAYGNSLVPLESYPADTKKNASLVLDNDIQIVLISDINAKKSTISVSLPVGSFYESVTWPGLARLHQSMIMSASKNYPQAGGMKEFIESYQGENISSISGGVTNYSFSVDHSRQAKLADRLADMFNNPLFDNQTLKTKIRELHSEWYKQKTSNEWLRKHLLASFAGEHSINHFLLGNLYTLKGKDNVIINELKKYHDSYYSSNIMKVVMISNKPLDEMEEVAKQYFGKIKNKNVNLKTNDDPIDMAKLGGYNVYIADNEINNKIMMMIPLQDFSSVYLNKLHVIFKRVMFDDQTNTALRRLQKHGLIQDVGLEILQWPDNKGFIELTVNMTNEGIKRKSEVIDMIAANMKLLRHKGIDKGFHEEMKQTLSLESLVYASVADLKYSSNIADKMHHDLLERVLMADLAIPSYDEQHYSDFLSQINPENMIIFHHDAKSGLNAKIEYFSNGYSIEPFSETEFNDNSQFTSGLSLPTVNKYIPQNLSVNSYGHFDKPTLIERIEDIDVWYVSNKVAHYPIGAVSVYFNMPETLDNLEIDVALALFVEVLTARCETLINHAKSAINEISFHVNAGFRLMIYGIPDKHADMLSDLNQQMHKDITQDELNGALQRYIARQLARGSDILLRQSFNQLTAIKRPDTLNYKKLIELSQDISALELNEIVNNMLAKQKPRLFFSGSYSKESISKLTEYVADSMVASDAKKQASEYRVEEFFIPEFPKTYVIEQESETSESAVMDVYIDSVEGIESKSTAILFVMMVKSGLSQEATLGLNQHNISIFYREIGDFSGIAFFNSDSSKPLETLVSQIDRFKKEVYVTIERIDLQTFNEMKSEVTSQIDPAVQNLESDINYHIANWIQQIPDEQSKVEVLKAINNVSVNDIRNMYKRLFLDTKSASRVFIQYRNKDHVNQKDKPFYKIKDSIVL